MSLLFCSYLGCYMQLTMGQFLKQVAHCQRVCQLVRDIICSTNALQIWRSAITSVYINECS